MSGIVRKIGDFKFDHLGISPQSAPANGCFGGTAIDLERSMSVRAVLKKIWYVVFNKPPMYLVGKVCILAIGNARSEQLREQFTAQTQRLPWPMQAVGRAVRAVESFDYGRLPDKQKEEWSKKFWGGRGGARWHHDRPVQIREVFERQFQDCVDFLGDARFERVIEIGCGNAWSLRYFARVWPSKMIGVDINPETVADARKDTPVEIELHVSDVFSFLRSYDDLSRTLVISRFTLVFFTNEQVHNLLAIVRERHGNLYICENHYHTLGTTESVYSGAHKISHDYPLILTHTGFKVLKQMRVQPRGEGALLRVLAAPA
jgi:SAM-dependent methyltransferase